MKKIIMAAALLTAMATTVTADTLIGAEVAAGKSHSNSSARVNTGIVKFGYDGESARLFAFGGMDHYNDNEGSAKYYGAEFDKKFEDFYLGLGMAFGKKNMKGYELGFRDLNVKAGHTWDMNTTSVDAGLKFTDRNYKSSPERDRLVQFFVGYNFNL